MIPGVNIVHKSLEQVHLVVGFPGLAHGAPERYALFVLNDVVGGSMSSRLFQEVRERQGLVYSIHTGVQAFSDTGLLYVYAASDAPNFSKVLKSIFKEIRTLKKDGITAEELTRAKDHLKGSLMLSLESTSSRMNRLAKHELHLGSFLTMDQMLAAIDGVRHEGSRPSSTSSWTRTSWPCRRWARWTAATCPPSCGTDPGRLSPRHTVGFNFSPIATRRFSVLS